MPVSRLNSVLLPELGLPTTAMLADGRRRTGIWSADNRVTDSLLTLLGRRYGEVLCLLATQGNRIAEHPEFQGIATYGSACKLYFGALDQTQNHQPLNVRVSRVNVINDVFPAALK
jgi:hypothetical protein